MPDDPLPIDLTVFRSVITYESTLTLCRRTAESFQRQFAPPSAPPEPYPMQPPEPCMAFEPLPSAWYENTGSNDPYMRSGPSGERAITPGGLYNNASTPVPLDAWKPSMRTEDLPTLRNPILTGRLDLPPLLHIHEDLKPRFRESPKSSLFDIPITEPKTFYKPLEPVFIPEPKPFVYKEPVKFDMPKPFVPEIPERFKVGYKPPEPVYIPEWRPPQAFGLEGPGEARRIGNEVERVRLDFGHSNRPYPHWNSEIYDADDSGVLSTKPKRRGIINDDPLVPQLPKNFWDR